MMGLTHNPRTLIGDGNSVRAMAITAALLLCSIVIDRSSATAVSLPCSSPINVGALGTDYTLSGCTTVPTLVVTISAASSFTLLASTIQGLHFTSISTISNFNLVISSSKISSASNPLVQFDSPLFSSGITISSTSSLSTTGGFPALSIAGQSQILNVLVKSSTISVASGAMIIAASGLFGGDNVISLATATLTGTGPALLVSGGVLSSKMIITSGGSYLLTSAALVTSAASVIGFSFVGYTVGAAFSCNGGAFVFDTVVTGSSFSFVGAAPITTWTTGSANGILSVGGTSNNIVLMASAVTITTGFLVSFSGAAYTNTISLIGASIVGQHPTTAVIQLGAATAPYHSITVVSSSCVSPAVATSKIVSTASFLKSMSDMASSVIMLQSTSITTAGTCFSSVGTFGVHTLAGSSSTLSSSGGNLWTPDLGSTNPITISLVNTALTASSNGGVYGYGFATPNALSHSGNTLVCDTCSISTYSYFLYYGAYQSQMDITLTSTTWTTGGLVSFAAGAGTTTLTYLSTVGTANSHVIKASAALTSLYVYLDKASSGGVASQMLGSGASVLSLTAATSVSLVATSSSTITSFGFTTFTSSSTISSLVVSLTGNSVISGSSANIFTIPATTVNIYSSDSLIKTTSSAAMAFSTPSTTSLTLFLLRSTMIGTTGGITCSGTVTAGSSISLVGSTLSVTSAHAISFSASVLGLSLYFQSSAVTSGSSAIVTGASVIFNTWAAIGTSISSPLSTFYFSGDVVGSFHGLSTTITSGGFGIFRLTNVGATNQNLVVVLDTMAIEATTGQIISTAGICSTLSMEMYNSQIGITSSLGFGLISAVTVSSLSLMVTSSTVTGAGSASASMVKVSSVASSSTISISSSKIVATLSSNFVAYGTTSGAGPHVLTMNSGTLYRSAAGGTFGSFSGAIVSMASFVVDCTITSGSLWTWSAGATASSLTVTNTPLVLSGSSVVAIGGASSNIGLTFSGTSSSIPMSITSSASTDLIALYGSAGTYAVSTVAISLTHVVFSAVGTSNSVFVSGSASSTVSAVGISLAASDVTIKGTSQFFWNVKGDFETASFSLTSCSLQLSSSCITDASVATTGGTTFIMDSTTIAGSTAAAFVVLSGTLSSVGVTLKSSSVTITAAGTATGVIQLASASLVNSLVSASFSASTVVITTATVIANPTFVLMLVRGGGTYTGVSVRSVSTVFQTNHATAFSTGVAQLDSASKIQGPQTNVVELTTSTFSTTTDSRFIANVATGSTMSGVGISVNCLSWSTTTVPLVLFSGVSTDVSIVMNSVAMWKTQSNAVISVATAASSGLQVSLYDSKLFGSNIILPAVSNNVAAISVGCSWSGNYHMTVDSFHTLIQGFVHQTACVQMYNPSCWGTLSGSKSDSMSRSTNMTVSHDTFTPSDSQSSTVSTTASGSETPSPSAPFPSKSETTSMSGTESSSTTHQRSLSPSVSPTPTSSFSNVFTSSNSWNVSASRNSATETTSETPSISEDMTVTLRTMSLSDSSTPSNTTSDTLSVSRDPTASYSGGSLTQPMSETVSLSDSWTPSSTLSRSLSDTVTPTVTIGSATPSFTFIPSVTRTLSTTNSSTVSFSPSLTQSGSGSSSVSLSVSFSWSRSTSLSVSGSDSLSDSASPSYSVTEEPSISPSNSLSTMPSETRSASTTESTSFTISPTASDSPSPSTSVTPSNDYASTTRSASGTYSESTSMSITQRSLTPEPSYSETMSQSKSNTRSRSLTLSNTQSASFSKSDSMTTTQFDSQTLEFTHRTDVLTISKTWTGSQTNSESFSPQLASMSVTTTDALSTSATASFTQTNSQSLIYTIRPTRTRSRSQAIASSSPTLNISLSRQPPETASHTESASQTGKSTTRDLSSDVTHVPTKTISDAGSATHSESRTSSSTPSVTVSPSNWVSTTNTMTHISRSKRRTRTNTLEVTVTPSNTTSRSGNTIPLSLSANKSTPTTVLNVTHTSTLKVTQTRGSASVSAQPTLDASRSKSMSLGQMSASETYTVTRPKRPSATVLHLSPTRSPTETVIITLTRTKPTLTLSRSILSSTLSGTTDVTVTDTLPITSSTTLTSSVTDSMLVTRPSPLVTISISMTLTPTKQRNGFVWIDGGGDGGNAQILMSVTTTLTMSDSVTAMKTGTRTMDVTQTPNPPPAPNLAAFRISDYELIVSSDCFKGSMAILLPLYGVIAAITLIQKFILVRDVIETDEGLRVSRLRHFGAAHLYLGLLFPCHSRCVWLHGLEVAEHVTLILAWFALMFYLFKPPSTELRIVVGAAAVLLSTILRSLTGRLGWWYRGRKALHLRAFQNPEDTREDKKGSKYRQKNLEDDEGQGDAHKKHHQKHREAEEDGWEVASTSSFSSSDGVADGTRKITIGDGGSSSSHHKKHHQHSSSEVHSHSSAPAPLWQPPRGPHEVGYGNDVDEEGEFHDGREAYYGEVDLTSVYDPDRMSRHSQLASRRDQDVLDLMSLPASLFDPASRSDHSNKTSEAAPTKAAMRRSSTWFSQPLAAVEEEVPSFGSSSVDLDEILEMADFRSGVDDTYGPTNKKSRRGDDVVTAVMSVGVDSDIDVVSSWSLPDPVPLERADDLVSTATSQGGPKNALNDYSIAYTVNGVLFVTAVIGLFLLVAEVSRLLQCESFSTAGALSVFVFDIFAVQVVYTLLLQWSLWRNRHIHIQEHVWKLHPR